MFGPVSTMSCGLRRSMLTDDLIKVILIMVLMVVLFVVFVFVVVVVICNYTVHFSTLRIASKHCRAF